MIWHVWKYGTFMVRQVQVLSSNAVKKVTNKSTIIQEPFMLLVDGSFSHRYIQIVGYNSKLILAAMRSEPRELISLNGHISEH